MGGPEGATSTLEVRSGDLILRFMAGVSELDGSASSIGAELPALRQLAEHTLNTLPTTEPVLPSAPKVDYTLELDTGTVTPLPRSIIRSLGPPDVYLKHFVSPEESGQFAVSSDGSRLAYVGSDDDGKHQIFIAGIDGTDVRQMTNDQTGAASPAWSPDGTQVAYVGYGGGDVTNLFVLDVASGESKQVTHGERRVYGTQFTPDGSALVYSSVGSLWTVPVDGGKSRLMVGAGEGVNDAGNGSLSPDGSLVTFLGSGEPTWDGAPDHCGPCRFVADADGTNRRVVRGWVSNPAGTWSPDGSRIVSTDEIWPPTSVVVVDVATGLGSTVAEGRGAIWIDRHTLLVEV